MESTVESETRQENMITRLTAQQEWVTPDTRSILPEARETHPFSTAIKCVCFFPLLFPPFSSLSLNLSLFFSLVRRKNKIYQKKRNRRKVRFGFHPLFFSNMFFGSVACTACLQDWTSNFCYDKTCCIRRIWWKDQQQWIYKHLSWTSHGSCLVTPKMYLGGTRGRRQDSKVIHAWVTHRMECVTWSKCLLLPSSPHLFISLYFGMSFFRVDSRDESNEWGRNLFFYEQNFFRSPKNQKHLYW